MDPGGLIRPPVSDRVLLDASEALTNAGTRKLFPTFMEAFAAWIDPVLRAK